MSYFGGKGQDGVYQAIINQIPPHQVYIEPFLGAGAIMRHKLPAQQSLGIDLDAVALSGHRQNRLGNCALLRADALRFLASTIGKFGPHTFIYCDPPYPMGTRSCQRCRYQYEMADADHEYLLDILQQLPAMVMVTSYPNRLYDSALTAWRQVNFQSVARNGEARIEFMYMNYPTPAILHDDRYLGSTANKRQDITRRINRTRARLLKWPAAERLRLLRELLPEITPEEKAFLPMPAAAGDSAYPRGQAIMPAPDPCLGPAKAFLPGGDGKY